MEIKTKFNVGDMVYLPDGSGKILYGAVHSIDFLPVFGIVYRVWFNDGCLAQCLEHTLFATQEEAEAKKYVDEICEIMGVRSYEI